MLRVQNNMYILEVSRYQCFGDYWAGVADLPESWQLHLAAACAVHTENVNASLPTFTGEFSLAVTDCQLYLQGGFVTPYTPAASEAACRLLGPVIL